MYKEPKREFFLIILISAFAHLVLLIFLLLSRLDSSVRKYKDMLAKKKEKKEAKVVFKQQPQKKFTPQLTVAPAASPPPSAPQPVPKPQKPVPPRAPEPKPPEKKPTPQKPIERKPKAEKKQPEKKQPAKKIPATKLLRTEKPQPPEKEKPKPPKKKPEQKLRPKVTLADITKGFMEYARKENVLKPTVNSQNLITVLGKNIGETTADQLKHQRYIKKLFDCLDVSFKLLRRTFRFTQMPTSDMLNIFVLLDLNQQGRIASLQIVERSGNAQFDMFMLKVFQDAARSFPPVPSFFDTEIYSLPIQCYIPAITLLDRRRQVSM